MLLEHKDAITVMCHSWGTRPIVENGTVKGVIYESKEGRKAILAKVVIDATGDGDLYRQTGTPFESMADQVTRANTTALVWRIGGINWDLFYQWRHTHPEEMAALRQGLTRVAGFRCLPIGSNQNDICWMNSWHANRDCSVVKDQTETEMNTRNTMRDVLEYLRQAVPVAFRNAYLYDIAPQLGTRISRRLKGEYVMTTADFAYAIEHDDVIAWHSTICQVNDCGPVEIPYRAILPKGVENLLCPGRHLSADGIAIDWLDLIPSAWVPVRLPVLQPLWQWPTVPPSTTLTSARFRISWWIRTCLCPATPSLRQRIPPTRRWWRKSSMACIPTRPSWLRSRRRKARLWIWSSRRSSMPLPSTEPMPVPDQSEEGKPSQPPLDFWRSLVDKPGCQTTGTCNECGLCEH